MLLVALLRNYGICVSYKGALRLFFPLFHFSPSHFFSFFFGALVFFIDKGFHQVDNNGDGNVGASNDDHLLSGSQLVLKCLPGYMSKFGF